MVDIGAELTKYWRLELVFGSGHRTKVSGCRRLVPWRGVTRIPTIAVFLINCHIWNGFRKVSLVLNIGQYFTHLFVLSDGYVVTLSSFSLSKVPIITWSLVPKSSRQWSPITTYFWIFLLSANQRVEEENGMGNLPAADSRRSTEIFLRTWGKIL